MTTPIHLFVYGTLKRGFHNHRLCAQAMDIRPAWTWGRLYHLRVGYPALEVPDHLILAHGSDRPRHDAILQGKTLPFPVGKPPGDWDWVSGELVTLGNPEADLPPIDRLEGFQANGRHNLYDRVLVPVWTEDEVVRSVWTYDGRRIPGRLKRCIGWPPAPAPGC